MYSVYSHAQGRPVVKKGPMAGCLNYVQNRWTCMTQRPVGLEKAKKLADSLPFRAVVSRWSESKTVYDNGRSPELPEGWYPIDAEVPDWAK